MLLKRKILVVDDEQDHIELCSRILASEGFEVEGVADCEALQDLLDIVLTFQPHLVFVDHSMPHICGLDAVQMLKAHQVTKNIPVIYFSAHQDIAGLAETAGADGLLMKPFDVDSLVRVVDLYI